MDKIRKLTNLDNLFRTMEIYSERRPSCNGNIQEIINNFNIFASVTLADNKNPHVQTFENQKAGESL